MRKQLLIEQESVPRTFQPFLPRPITFLSIEEAEEHEERDAPGGAQRQPEARESLAAHLL